MYLVIAKFGMLVNGSISYGERPGGSVLVSRSGSIAVSVKALNTTFNISL